MRKIFLFARGTWRVLWYLCPHCNSDAPAIYECIICNGYRSSYSGLPRKDRWMWLKRYKNLIRERVIK
jgi:hypothetical protein